MHFWRLFWVEPKPKIPFWKIEPRGYVEMGRVIIYNFTITYDIVTIQFSGISNSVKERGVDWGNFWYYPPHLHFSIKKYNVLQYFNKLIIWKVKCTHISYIDICLLTENLLLCLILKFFPYSCLGRPRSQWPAQASVREKF